MENGSLSEGTHRYTGPSTIYGLARGADVVIVRRGPSGMLTIRPTSGRRTFNVARHQLQAR